MIFTLADRLVLAMPTRQRRNPINLATSSLYSADRSSVAT
jgi:hypothetical protein